MAGKLQHEIGKRQPFACAEEEALLSILRTADVLHRAVAEIENIIKVERAGGI